MKVGFIGLGAMGRPMAGHLQKAGHQLFVWARRPASVGDLAATLCATPAELGRCCDVVFTVVTSSADVERLALGRDGLIEGMAPGSVLIDCSTIAPDSAREIAARLSEKGIALLDAPVSGGEQGAIDATLACSKAALSASARRKSCWPNWASNAATAPTAADKFVPGSGCRLAHRHLTEIRGRRGLRPARLRISGVGAQSWITEFWIGYESHPLRYSENGR